MLSRQSVSEMFLTLYTGGQAYSGFGPPANLAENEEGDGIG